MTALSTKGGSMPVPLSKVSIATNGSSTDCKPGEGWISHTVTPQRLADHLDISHLQLPPQIRVVDSGAGRKFLTGRELWGWTKVGLLKEITRYLVRAATDVLEPGKMVQFVPLRGADPMKIGKALASAGIYPYTIAPIFTVAFEAQRHLEGNDFVTEVSKPLKPFPRHPVIVFVDTCSASGSTVRDCLRHILEWYEKDRPKRVIFFSACCSLRGVANMWSVCQEHDIEFIPVLSTGILSVFPESGVLGKPWTDLSPISEFAVMPDSFIDVARVYYQGRPMCAVSDVGESLGEEFFLYILSTLRELAILRMNLQASPWDTVIDQTPRQTWQAFEVLARAQPEVRSQLTYIRSQIA